ncbi:RNA polymerase sigma factor [Actinosynnema sp. CS-041913]|uniref:RNA polymerase sigma factor n=1 Tax=Actinosynnema sp. CS-041913 TaxID=3239917 RepID=UPI003D9406DE
MADEDLPLLDRLRAGDSTARHQLFLRCQAKIRPYFHHRTDRHEDVDDLVSEVVVRALEGIRNGLEPKELDAWLTGIAHNVLKAHYTENARRGDREVPEDLAEPPSEIEDLIAREQVLAVLTDSLDGVPPGLRPVMATHIRLTLRTDHLVVGGELAKELGVSRGQADRQLDRARKATGKAIAAYVVTRVGQQHCDSLAALAAGPFDPKQPDIVLDHAKTCEVCAKRQQDAHDYARWALGPGLLGLADDDENRRTALAFFSRGTDVAAPRAGLLGTVGTKVASIPGVDAFTRLAQENPAVVRVAAGAVGLVAAAVIAVLATENDRPEGLALPPPPSQLTGIPGVVETIVPETTTTPGGVTTTPTQPPRGAQPIVVTATTPRPVSQTPTSPPTSPSSPTPTPTSETPFSPPPTSPSTSTPPPRPARWAYARVEPAESPIGVETDLIATWQWGTPQPAKVTRESTGVYRLRLPGQASATAVAHTTVTYDQSAQPMGCVVRDNRTVGADQIVVVACANGSTPINTRFNFLLAEPGDRAAVIPPDAPVRRLGPGLYEARISGFTGNGYVQITPYGTDFARCQSGGVTGTTIRVRCTTDTKWAATYVEGAPPAGEIGAYAQTTGTVPDLRIDPTRSYNSTGGAFRLHRLGLGHYRVLAKGVGTWGGTVLSGATDTGHCRTSGWHAYPYPANEIWVDVQCFDDAGQRADLQFGIAAVRKPLDPGERLGPLQPADPGPHRPGWGYAQVHQYGYALDVPVQLHPNHQWSTWGGYLPGNDHWWARKMSLLRTDVGEYTVRMPGLGSPQAIAHVTAHSQAADTCVVREQRVDGIDGLVGVNCFGPNGQPKDLTFHVYLGVPESGAVTSDSATRLGTGEYEVVVPGGQAGYVQVTPLGREFARCRSDGGQAVAGEVRVRVHCDRDARWQLSHVHGTGLHQDAVPAGYLTVDGTGRIERSYSANGETPVVTRSTTGRYVVNYSALGNRIFWPADSVQVTALGEEPRTCRVIALNSYTTPGQVRGEVWCHDLAGSPADADFGLAYVRPPDR